MNGTNINMQPSPQQHDDNVAAAALIYLLALVCTEKDTCADVLEVIFALVLTIASLKIAQMPSKEARYRFPERDIAKFSMCVLWTLSAVAGGYAASNEYTHYLRDIYEPDSVDKFNALASSSLSGALVTTIFSAASAGAVHFSTPTIVNMYNKAKNACRRSTDNANYRLLEGEDLENQTPPASKCRGLCFT